MRTLIDQQVVGYMDRLSLYGFKAKPVALEEFVHQTMQELFQGNRISGVLSL